ncbi:MAG TPA: hypothetical protein PL113_13335, partial [Bacteroidia bacterium]|nr:hypothetical protein [Bacteroidia bacterium]
MKRSYACKTKVILSIFTVSLLLVSNLKAQTPQYKFENNTTGSNSIPWGGGSWADQRNQWFWAPGDFGNNVMSGFITKIYFKTGSIANSPTTYTNLVIRMGQPNIMGLTTAWETGLTTVLTSASYTISGVSTYSWFAIPLQTYFLFDPSKPLVIETIQTGTSGGFALAAGGTPINPSYTGNTQTYGASSASSGTTRRYSYALGFDVIPASGFDLAMYAVKSPAVFNVGNNQLTVTVMNRKADTIKWFDLGYQFENNSPVVVTNHYPSSPILSGKSYDYTFSTPVYVPSKGTYTLKTWVGNANDSTPDNDKTNDTLKITFCTGMSGTFTIGGSGADYANFASAISALQSCGIAGPVTFIVSPGTYYERVVIPQIPGSGPTSPIKFLGSGISTCKITYAGTSTDYSTIFLNGADYVTIDGFTIENTGSSYSVGITLGNEANNNVISNNLISVYQGTSSSMIGLRGSASDGSTSAGSIGYNNYIYNNRITGGYYGIYWYNTGGSTSPKTNYNNTYEKNIIDNFYYYGAYFYYNGGTKFKFNKIYQPRYSYAYGLMMYYPAGDTIVSNIIEPGYVGIYYYYYANQYNSGWKSLIANNFIYNFANYSNYTIGIYNYYYNYYVTIANNTIWMNCQNASYNSYTYAGIYCYYPYYNEIYNNIIINEGYNFMISFYYPYYTKCDYNLYYLTSSAYGGNPSSYYQYYYYPESTSSIPNFQSFLNLNSNTTYLGQHDVNSLPQYDPKVISNMDLHNIPGFKGYLGKFIPGLLYDVDGDLRCVFQTYLGADGPFHSAPTVGFVASDTICQITPVTFFNTSQTNDPYLVKWFVDDVEKSTDFHFSYAFQNTGQYNVKLAFQSCVRTDTFQKNVIATTPSAVPLTEFMVSKSIVEVQENVPFFDLSYRCPEKWKWEITPSKVKDPYTGLMVNAYSFKNNTNDTFQNPVVSFNYPGAYTVSLITQNKIGAAPKLTKTNYINVKFSDNLCGTYNETDQKYGTLYDDGGAG